MVAAMKVREERTSAAVELTRAGECVGGGSAQSEWGDPWRLSLNVKYVLDYLPTSGGAELIVGSMGTKLSPGMIKGTPKKG